MPLIYPHCNYFFSLSAILSLLLLLSITGHSQFITIHQYKTKLKEAVFIANHEKPQMYTSAETRQNDTVKYQSPPQKNGTLIITRDTKTRQLFNCVDAVYIWVHKYSVVRLPSCSLVLYFITFSFTVPLICLRIRVPVHLSLPLAL